VNFDDHWTAYEKRLADLGRRAEGHRVHAQAAWDAAIASLIPATKADWESNWQRYPLTKPPLFEPVIVKSNTSVVSIDWLEPLGGQVMFSENHGLVSFWMPCDVFGLVAPQGAREHLEPLNAETIIRLERRKQRHTDDAGAVPLRWRRDHRCPHGVATENFCTKCD
jgi:hypothetical protein